MPDLTVAAAQIRRCFAPGAAWQKLRTVSECPSNGARFLYRILVTQVRENIILKLPACIHAEENAGSFFHIFFRRSFDWE